MQFNFKFKLHCYSLICVILRSGTQMNSGRALPEIYFGNETPVKMLLLLGGCDEWTR